MRGKFSSTVGAAGVRQKGTVDRVRPGASRERPAEIERRYDPANVFSGTL